MLSHETLERREVDPSRNGKVGNLFLTSKIDGGTY